MTPRGGYEVTPDDDQRAPRGCHAQARPPARTAAPRPPSRPAPTVAAPPTSDPHRFGRVDPDGTVWLITAAGERVIGSWQAGDTEAAFAHFGRRFDDLHTEVALMERRLSPAPAMPARSSRPRRAWSKVCRRPRCSATSTRWPPGWRRSSSTPTPRRRPSARGATSTGPRKPLARRRWPPRPRTWRPTRLSGRPPGTGCARSSRSGARSAGWTARSTTRCGSGTRRHARPSTGAAGRISPNSTANASAPVRPRRSCVSAPRNYPTPPSGAPPVRVFRDLLTAVEGRRPGGQGCRRRAVAAVQGGPGQVLRRPQRGQLRTRRRVPRERRSQGGVAGRGRKDRHRRSDAARAALRAIGEKWDAIGKVPRERGAELERRLRAVEKKVRDAASSRWADPEAQARADQFRGPGRAIRASGGEGRGRRPDQGCRGGARKRRAVATVGRGGGRRAGQEALAGAGCVQRQPV